MSEVIAGLGDAQWIIAVAAALLIALLAFTAFLWTDRTNRQGKQMDEDANYRRTVVKFADKMMLGTARKIADAALKDSTRKQMKQRISGQFDSDHDDDKAKLDESSTRK